MIIWPLYLLFTSVPIVYCVNKDFILLLYYYVASKKRKKISITIKETNIIMETYLRDSQVELSRVILPFGLVYIKPKGQLISCCVFSNLSDMARAPSYIQC